MEGKELIKPLPVGAVLRKRNGDEPLDTDEDQRPSSRVDAADAEDERTDPPTPHVCNPCVFVSSIRGCALGNDCRFCHLPHPHPSASQIVRPRRERRDRMKQQVLEHLSAQSQEQMQEPLQELAQRHLFTRHLIRTYLNEHWAIYLANRTERTFWL